MKTLEEIHSSEHLILFDLRLLELDEVHLDNGNIEYSNKLIYKNALEFFGTKLKTVFLGGDHSISYSIVRAFLDYCRQNEKEPCLIVFDAHADCMTPMQEPTHEEWLRGIIEAGFPAENILLVGARNMWKDEIEFLKKNKIKMVGMDSLLNDLHETCDTIMEFASNKELYISIDIDIIDPAFAPATGYCEPGGLTSRQFIYLIQRMNKIKNLKAVDLVEVNPEKDEKFSGMTIKLGARILGELYV